MVMFDDFNDIDAELNHFNGLYPDLDNEVAVQYYSLDSYKTNVLPTISSNNLRIINVNIRSLFPKFDSYFTSFLNGSLSFDIYCFTESWLTEESSKLLEIPNYK